MKSNHLLFVFLLAGGSLSSSLYAQDIAMSEEEADAIESTLGNAVEAMQGNRFEDAIDLLEPLSRRPDAPPQIGALLGAAYVEGERPQQALAVLEPLLEKQGEDAAMLYNAGRAALAVGRSADGERYLTKAASLAPVSPAARLLGFIRTRQGLVVDSYRLLRPLALANPDDTEARLAAATAAVQLQRISEAEQLLSDLPQIDSRVRLLWGRLLLLKGEPDGARSMLEPLIGANLPEEILVDARRLMADVELELGNATAARNLLGDLARDPMTAYKLSKAEYQSGNVEAAIAALEPFRQPLLEGLGTEMTPTIRAARATMTRALGGYLVAAGRHDEALPVLETSAQLDPNAKEAWQSLGQALAGLGRRDEAEKALAKFRALADSEGSVLQRQNRAGENREDATGRELRKASQLIGEGRFEAALGIVRTELALSPEDPRPRLAESRILLLLGQHDEALASVERALGKSPSFADAWYQRGAVRLANKDLDGAEGDLRHALELNDQHLAAMNDLAVLLIVQGNRDEARTLLERVLSVNPNDRGAAQNLERLNNASS